MRGLRRAIVCVALAVAMLACGGAGRRSPILVLVSFDGWRWDYTDRATVPNVRALASRGVRAAGLIPSFPSMTFPNHYTIVTGLYPERHGIVSNNIFDPTFAERFSMDAETSNDARWWGGEPLWLTAMRQGRRAASMFWPGSEAPIQGSHPTYWRPFDDELPNAARVKQVLDWLALPPQERPAFVTLYFSDVDTVGHDHGPESSEVLEAAARLDELLGELLAGVEKLDLSDRTSIVLVSDHGMSQLSDERVIFLDDYIDLSSVDVVDLTPTLGLAPRSGPVDALYESLKGRHPALAIYRRDEVPAHLHYRDNARIPPVIGVVDDGWRITSRERFARDRAAGRSPGGAHGYDPSFKSMHGLFVAAGPRVAEGRIVDAFENVHIYEFLCAILGLVPAPNEGNPAVTRWFLE